MQGNIQNKIPHNYRKGDYITIKKPCILQKLALPREEPFKVMKHNNNGSVLIEKAPTKVKNVNVQRVAPYHYKTETPTMNRS